MEYRSEIDGLRALAVVPVVLFHAGISIFSGGYAGVDIFFVISGFLITGIVLREIETDSFSIVGFYERRARRILPALFAVLAVTTLLSFWVMYPTRYAAFSESLTAVALFVSNVHFWQNAGYFTLDAEREALLHTWSLAVEEQYYLIFPWLLVLMRKWKKATTLTVLFILAGLSLALSEWGVENEPDANFFFTFSRFWELIAGSITAVALQGSPRRVGSELLSLLGLALIFASYLLYDQSTPFPSLYTLVPVLGTVLVLVYAVQGTLVARILSLKPILGVGLISYSFYLWHQPVFALAKTVSVSQPGLGAMLALSALALGLAYLSWRFVEQPFRRKQRVLLPNRVSFFWVCGAGIALFSGVGIVGKAQDGFMNRYNQQQRDVLAILQLGGGHPEILRSCFLEAGKSMADFPDHCLLPNSDVLLVGDSHAASISTGFRASVKTSQLSGSACPPIVSPSEGREPFCAQMHDAFPDVLKRTNPRTVVLHANWVLAGEAALAGFGDTIAMIREISPQSQIIVLGGVPQWSPSLPERMLDFDVPLAKERMVVADIDRVRQADKELARLSEQNAVIYLDLTENQCDAVRCLGTVFDPAKQKMTVMAYDYGHLTARGATLTVETLVLPFLNTAPTE